MFKLQPNPTFMAAVALSVPGAAEPATLTIEFRHLSRSAIKAYFEGLSGKSDAEALDEIIVSWTGADAPYSTTNLALLLDNYPAAATELFDAYRRELMEARRKN